MWPLKCRMTHLAAAMTDIDVSHPPLTQANGRPTRIRVDLDALAGNLRALRAHAGVPVMGIVKANAYGHGLVPVALHLLAEYGLYVMIRFDTFTTAIYDQFQSTFSGPAANMLAGVLALCCLAILLLESASRGKARYARIGAGAARGLTADGGLGRIGCDHHAGGRDAEAQQGAKQAALAGRRGGGGSWSGHVVEIPSRRFSALVQYRKE